jgi:hypothetical protein
MAMKTLAENCLSYLISDFERNAAAGVDFVFFCYRNGIAPNDLQPFVAKLKSDGLVIELRFQVYALTGSGYERHWRSDPRVDQGSRG